jgi:hypothetical protein
MSAEEMWDHCKMVAEEMQKLRERVQQDFGVDLSYNELLELYDALKRNR